MNFAFRQEKPKWDCVWPDYEQPVGNKSNKLEELEEEVRTIKHFLFTVVADADSLSTQDEPSDWDDSWRVSDLEHLTLPVGSSAEATVEINEVFMPGWRDSWQLSAPPEEQHKRWSTCWSYRQQMR